VLPVACIALLHNALAVFIVSVPPHAASVAQCCDLFRFYPVFYRQHVLPHSSLYVVRSPAVSFEE
jgi:hypothetical protein